MSLVFIFAFVLAVFGAENEKANEKRDKRGLLPLGYAAAFPYAAAPYATYPYAYAPTAYSTYSTYSSPFAYPALASPIVAAPAPIAYFR